MTKQSILIDNKKRTVSSTKIKKADPDVLAVRTNVFGQFNDIEFNKDYFIFIDDKHCLHTRLLLHTKGIRIEYLEFRIIENYSISLPTALDEVNTEDDNIDVCVRTESGQEYTFVISTKINIAKHPGLRALVVDKLTMHNIKTCIGEIMSQENGAIDYYGRDIDGFDGNHGE